MKLAFEFLGFASVAALAHLAVFAATLPDGMAAGGAGGQQEITQPSTTLAGADNAMAALVARWDMPPIIGLHSPTETVAAPLPDAPPILTMQQPNTPRVTQTMTRPAQADTAPDVGAPPDLFTRPQNRDTPRPRPAPRQAQPREASATAASRAAGQGGAAQQRQGQAQVQSGSTASASQLTQWGGSIRAAIQRQQRSPSLRAQGIVHLRLQVSADGRLVGVALSQSSGHAALDRAALQAVQRASLPRAPAGVSGTHHFNLPLRFE